MVVTMDIIISNEGVTPIYEQIIAQIKEMILSGISYLELCKILKIICEVDVNE